MTERLTIVGKVIIFLPLSAFLWVIWLPYWVITGRSPFPAWVRHWWKEWSDAQDYH